MSGEALPDSGVIAIVEAEEKTSLYIKADVYGTQILINGIFYGYDEVSFDDIKPGHYLIEAIKPGYEKAFYEIYLRKGEKRTVYVHLELIKGFIEFLNYPEGASVFVDGMYVTSTLLEIGAGTHSVQVKKFGFKELNTFVEVIPYDTVALNIDLEEAEFRLYDFSVSRNKINPEVNGLSTTVFSFKVTADKPVVVTVSDIFGTIVKTFRFENFYTWNNACKWNGCDDNGIMLPDGYYTVLVDVLSGVSHMITIDRSLRYTVQSYTYSGGGIGTLPVAYNITKTAITPFVNLEPVFEINNLGFGFKGCLVNTGVLFNIGKYVECGISAGSKFGSMQSFPFFMNASVKGGAGIVLGGYGSGCYLNFAGLLRYGYSSFNMRYYGGRGLGVGAVVGFENRYFYCGLSSEAALGINDGNLTDGSFEWKNGLAVSFKPTDFSHLSLWGAYSNDSLFDFGFEYIVMPGANGFSINLATKMVVEPKITFYFSEKIGLSYSF